jgi:hypothetical protein
VTDSAAVGGPLTPPRASENSRLSSTESESKSMERESDSDPPPPPPPSGDPRDTRRSLVVKVVSGEGLPESSDRLSRDAPPPPAVVDSGTAMMEAVGGRPPVGAWLMEWRWGAARERGGVAGGPDTEA